jgi:stage V sporulation protein K
MDRFLHSNPGLPSRFPIHLDFPDFTIDELIIIADRMAQQRQYRLSNSAKEKMRRQLIREMNRSAHPFGNARYVRNLVEQSIRLQAVRLLNTRYPTRDDLMLIRAEDLQFEKTPSPSFSWYT